MKLYVLLIYLVHFVTGEAVTSFGLLNDEMNVRKTCTMEKANKLVGYDCSNLNLKDVPQHLRSSVEVSSKKLLRFFQTSFYHCIFYTIFDVQHK